MRTIILTLFKNKKDSSIFGYVFRWINCSLFQKEKTKAMILSCFKGINI